MLKSPKTFWEGGTSGCRWGRSTHRVAQGRLPQGHGWSLGRCGHWRARRRRRPHAGVTRGALRPSLGRGLLAAGRQDTSPFVPAVWRGPAARSESGALAAGRGQPLRRRRRREGARPRLGGVGDLQSLRGPSHCPENIPLSPNTGAAFVKATFAPLEVKCNSPRKD